MSKPATFMLNETVWLMSKHADRILQQHFNMTYSWFVCLAALSSVEPTSQHALARALSYSDAAVSRLLHKLVAASLVLSEVSAVHGRKNIIKLSDEGREALMQATELLESEFSRALKDAGVDGQKLVESHCALNQTLKRRL